MKYTTLLAAMVLVGLHAQAQTPSMAAPTPTTPAGNVISMFSDAYTDVPVDTWQTVWSAGTLADIMVAGNATKEYTNLDFVGVETVANQIDASSMDTFHVDMYTPNLTEFRIKLVDFGPDGAFQGGDDTEHELVFANPMMNTWVSLDLPLSDFVGLTNRANIAQLIFAGSPAGMGTVYIDNVYFSGAAVGPPATAPTVAAPTPTQAPADVISMFSDAYTDVTVDTWQTPWSSGALTDTAIAGNATKRYDNLDFVGIETVAMPIDASMMNTFHFDAWTPNMTQLRVKLVDFGANGVFDGPGVADDVEHELSYVPQAGTWNEYDISLVDFAGLTTTGNIGQLIFAGMPAGSGTLFIDNVYFSTQTATPTVPTVAAPTPTIPAAQVISMFSDAYTDVPVDTWQTVWSAATLTDIMIAGNPTKRYDNLDFVGVETVANQIDVSAMDTFHVDMWTANMTEFRIKLVDFGPDGAFQGGDDTEHEIVISNPAQGVWNSLSIPMADFVGLTTRNNIAQLIFSGNPSGMGTVFIDNVFFSEDGPTGIADQSAASFRMFPNPATDMVQVNATESIEQLMLMDMTGKQVLMLSPNSNRANIAVRALSSGSYVLLLNTASGSSAQHLIID